MSHQIDTTAGRAACFVAGQPAWHKLGAVVAEAQTSAEAIQLANLDWTVDLWPTFATNPDGGEPTPLPGQFAVVRSDTRAPLGTVGNYYRPFQNREAFDFMDAIVGERLAMFETAGALKGGRKVWMLATIPTEYRIAGDDVVQPFVLLTNSHDGTSGLRILPTTVRVVCNNTLTLALNRASSSEGLSIVHTDSLERRVAEARNKLGVINRQLGEFSTQAKALAKRSLNSEQLRDYFTAMVVGRGERSQTKLLESFWTNFHNERNTLPGIEGSAWAAYNAVSEFADHSMLVMGKGDAERLDNRVNSIWFGAANRMKQQAWQAVLAIGA